MNRSLRTFLRRRGATPEEIAEAASEERLALLALDRQLLPGRARDTFAGGCRARAGVDVEVARRLWRALGFPDVARRRPPCSRDADVDALHHPAAPVRQLAARRHRPEPGGAGAARARDRRLAGEDRRGAERPGRRSGPERRATPASTDEQIARARAREPRLGAHVAADRLRAAPAAAGRSSGASSRPRARAGSVRSGSRSGSSTSSATPRSARSSSPRSWARSSPASRSSRYDTVAEHGGRVVKTIGDEVMFVAEDAERRGADRAPAHAELGRRRRSCPDARAGLDVRGRARAGGRLLRARRQPGAAGSWSSRYPGTVLASSELHDGPGGRTRRSAGTACAAAGSGTSGGSRSGRWTGRRHQPRESRGGRGSVAILVMAESPRDQAGNPLAPAVGPRPPRRRSVEGRGHRREVRRRGHRTRARLLHRRRGGRHPQPGGRHARGPGRPPRGPDGGAAGERRRHRLRRRCTCSGTTTRACPTPRRTPVPTTSPTRRSTRPSSGSCASSGPSGRR